MNFKLFLEALDSKSKYEIVRHDRHEFVTRINISDRTLQFDAVYDEDKEVWDVVFSKVSYDNVHKRELHSYDKTGSGAEFQVFAFVKDSLLRFIDNYTPEHVEFTSEKADGNRTKLYQRMVKRFMPKDYTLDVDAYSHASSDSFSFTRD